MELETVDVEQPSVVRGSGIRGRNESISSSGFVLGPKDVLEGKLTIEGDLRIQGRMEGELRLSGDLNIDAGAIVKASIDARSASVRGQVTGNVNVKKRLQIAGSGVLNGDVRVQRLSVEDGATLNGNVTMGGSGSDRGSHESSSPETPPAEGA